MSISAELREMAERAGITFELRFGQTWTGNVQLEEFAKLVAEDCANTSPEWLKCRRRINAA